jgi:glycosyltransferase involved in cell wall biosynthesis
LTQEFEVTVFCSAKKYDEQPSTYLGAHLEYIDLHANGVQSIPYDILSLWRSRKFDRVLILGTSGCLALPFFRVVSRAKYFLNIDGLEWKRQKWSKLAKTYLRLSEIVGCRRAHALVADNAVIQNHITQAYGKSSQLIAYGGDNTALSESTDIADTIPHVKPYCFSVCRIEPENNTHIILDAFSRMPAQNLVFIGNWEANDYGKKLRKTYADFENIEILDPIYDRSILDQYRGNCDIYLHGHSAGGTNPSLVEAMSLELPVFSFDVDFNRETTENQATYFKDADELIEAVGQASKPDLHALANTMKEIADRRYTWKIVSTQYTDLLK